MLPRKATSQRTGSLHSKEQEALARLMELAAHVKEEDILPKSFEGEIPRIHSTVSNSGNTAMTRQRPGQWPPPPSGPAAASDSSSASDPISAVPPRATSCSMHKPPLRATYPQQHSQTHPNSHAP
eukprot:CAMPEP_0114274778 /NCGR_PEP_ID=MMETSP0058-20121206/29966_1 /TAXON_ID=36894 /ORGANISM="Pyramimonas parkeae, CCMP726" /LENGTH=124 /DNA_ID=CAMNT_0001394631 /DNA_START=1 /DNA_END=372 /DNA_ORIENTATION=-